MYRTQRSFASPILFCLGRKRKSNFRRGVASLAKQKQAEQVEPGWQAQSFTEQALLFPQSLIVKDLSYCRKLRAGLKAPPACAINFPAFLLLLNSKRKLNIKCCYKKAITESNKKANFKRFYQNAYRGGAKPRQKPKNSEAGFASEQSLFTLLSWQQTACQPFA